MRTAQFALVLFAVRAAQTLEVDVPVCMRRVLPTVVELDSDNRDVLGSMVRAAQPKAGSLAGDLGAGLPVTLEPPRASLPPARPKIGTVSGRLS